MHNEEALALLEMMDGLDELTDVAVDMMHENCEHSDAIHDVVIKLMVATTLLSHSEGIKKECEGFISSKTMEDKDDGEDEEEDISMAEKIAEETGYDEDTINEVLKSAYWHLKEHFDKEAEDGKDE